MNVRAKMSLFYGVTWDWSISSQSMSAMLTGSQAVSRIVSITNLLN